MEWVKVVRLIRAIMDLRETIDAVVDQSEREALKAAWKEARAAFEDVF